MSKVIINPHQQRVTVGLPYRHNLCIQDQRRSQEGQTEHQATLLTNKIYILKGLTINTFVGNKILKTTQN